MMGPGRCLTTSPMFTKLDPAYEDGTRGTGVTRLGQIPTAVEGRRRAGDSYSSDREDEDSKVVPNGCRSTLGRGGQEGGGEAASSEVGLVVTGGKNQGFRGGREKKTDWGLQAD